METLGDLTRTAWALRASDECERWSVGHGIGHGKRARQSGHEQPMGVVTVKHDSTVVDPLGMT